MTSRDYFKGKRVALIGLGPHGEMVEDAKYIIKQGALLSVYDLRCEARLKSHLVYLRSIGLANYVCGSVPAEDLQDMDLIILSHEYPRDSSFLNKLENKKIPIEYPETLFFKLAPAITFVGILGTYGKTTVLSALAPMLTAVCDNPRQNTTSIDDEDFQIARKESVNNQKCFFADSESGDGLLSHLKRMHSGDILVMRVAEKMMRELKNMRISPHVAIFTSIPSKYSYDQSPFEILDFQTYNNFIVASDEIIDSTHLYKFQSKAKKLRTKSSIISPNLDFKGRAHDRDNVALALQAGKLFKVSDEVSERVIHLWKPLKGRLEMVKKIKNVEYYNDTASVSPHSTIRAIMSLSENRNVILIMGGSESQHDYRELHAILSQYVRAVILLPGSGTIKERKALNEIEGLEVFSVPSLEEAVRVAAEKAQSGDKVLFSPGFDAGGYDLSRKERGERFIRAIRGL